MAAIDVKRTPLEIMADLKRAHSVLSGRCFENCVIAVLGLSRKARLQYILGFVTPPGYKAVPHAWLLDDSDQGPAYLDPTLQDGSQLWQSRSGEFIYDERYRLTKEELLAWFRSKYADRKFDEIGVPKGPVRGPIINAEGGLE
jgi:hypothetical protein